MQHQNKRPTVLENSEDFSYFLDHLLEGVLCLRFDGVITNFNTMAEKILSIKKNQILNTHFSKHFTDSFFGFPIQKALNEKKIDYFSLKNPYINLKISKNENHLDLEIKCFFDSNHLMIFIHDVTLFKESEKLAHASNRLKDLGSMTAMVAHEIRNPLGGIKGFASLLRRDLEKEPNLRQMAELIIDGADNLNHLVTHILNFAHPLQMEFNDVNLIELVQKLKNSLEVDEQLKNKKIHFNLKTELNEMIIPADGALLNSALLNLMVNAIQAMPNGGTLTINLQDKETYVQIEVIDTGIGISKENLKKIFSAFFTTKSSGNGFGLLEVYKVIQAHKGTIDVNSNLNEGTTFTIKLPKKG